MGYHGITYYNTKMFKGNTDKTGFSWWYDASKENPNRPSHYPGFIPLPLMREVLGWTAEESTKLIAVFEIPVVDDNDNPVRDTDGNQVVRQYEVPVSDHKAIGRGDWIVNGIPEDEEDEASKILSVVTTEYGVHQAKDVFLKNVTELLDGEENIGIESFGELKWGRRLFASFSIPENLTNKDSGLQFRPILTVVTSYDRTLATKFIRTYGVPICDNTLNWELAKAGDKEGSYTLKHSKNSAQRLGDAKKVLGLLTEQAEVMDSFVTGLMQSPVPEDKFIQWMNVMVPIPEIKKTLVTVKSIQGEDVQIEKESKKAQTMAKNRQDRLFQMWDNDPRVIGPNGEWKNTRLGVLQLWNTFQQHESTFKGSSGDNKVAARAQMNMDKTINGNFAVEDASALKAIDLVMADDEPVKVAVSKRASKANA